MYNILIAEDDVDIIEILTLYLESNDYKVFSAFNGKEALNIVNNNHIHLALVDIMMPEMNGYELIKEIRKNDLMPIIIMSAKSDDNDKILGLNIGADAYITKPFNPMNVIAEIKAIIRRSYEFQSDENKKITIGELTLDVEKYLLYKNEKVINLTSGELKIVSKLMKNKGQIFTKAQLYECIRGDEYESDDNTMMVHISKIRSKIEDDPSKPIYLKTVRGIGYKIDYENK